MNKFGNNGLHRLKSRMNGPGKDETIGVGSTDKDIAEQKQKMLNLVAKNKKKYQQQHGPIQNRQQPMLDADRLNDPNYGKDSFLTKLKTVVSNPFDSLTAVMGTNPAMTSLRQVRQLHEAKDRGDKDEIDFELLEGRRAYLKRLCNQIIATANIKLGKKGFNK